MLIIFVLMIIIFSVFVLISLFAPTKLPWYRPHLNLDKSELEVIKGGRTFKQPVVVDGVAEPEDDFHVSLEENVSRLEVMISEKNKIIEKLQKELTAEKRHRLEFEKIKSILDDEIKSLRDQNRELKGIK